MRRVVNQPSRVAPQGVVQQQRERQRHGDNQVITQIHYARSNARNPSMQDVFRETRGWIRYLNPEPPKRIAVIEHRKAEQH